MNILPIAIMSFDRPDYLEAVMQTLVRQTGFGGRQPEVFLFQDSGRAASTGEVYADPVKIAQCVELFRQYFPGGEVFEAPFNLGVAHNFDRAEKFFFIDNAFDCAVFLEDDMLLQPHYMEVLVELLNMALDNPHIGVVSAYGMRNDLPLEAQRRARQDLCLMNEHNWAFGITRACWEKRNRIVSHYLEIIHGVEYRERKARHPEINAMLRGLGRGGRGYLSSQDSIKNMACETLGIFRVSTCTNNARYIGRKGLHMTEERFFQRGYHRTVLYPEPHGNFAVPSIETLRALREVV